MATKYQGKVSFTLHDGGTEYPLAVKTWNIKRSRSDLVQWSVTLPGRRPYLPAGTVGAILARKEPFSDDKGTLQTWVTCSMSRDGVDEPLPKLLVLDYSSNESPTSVDITIGGLCQAHALNTKDQFMDQVRSTRTTAYSAHAVVEEICEEYGLGTPTINFEDFTVPQLLRMGQPISWLRGESGLLFPRRGWFRWNGTTLVFEPGGIDIDAATSIATVQERTHAKVLRFRTDRDAASNECTVQRTSELKNGLVEPKVGRGLGFQTITLDRPLNYVHLDVVLKDPGGVSLVTWYDEEDNPLTITGPNETYNGVTPAAKVQFSLDPPVDAGPFPTDISYSAYILGSELIGDFSENVSETYSDDDDIADRRRLAVREPLVVPMCPGPAEALDCATRTVREEQRKYLMMSLDMSLWPAFRPGSVFTFTSLRYDLSAVKFLIEAQNMQGDANSHTMTIDICRGPW